MATVYLRCFSRYSKLTFAPFLGVYFLFRAHTKYTYIKSSFRPIEFFPLSLSLTRVHVRVFFCSPVTFFFSTFSRVAAHDLFILEAFTAINYGNSIRWTVWSFFSIPFEQHPANQMRWIAYSVGNYTNNLIAWSMVSYEIKIIRLITSMSIASSARIFTAAIQWEMRNRITNHLICALLWRENSDMFIYC